MNMINETSCMYMVEKRQSGHSNCRTIGRLCVELEMLQLMVHYYIATRMSWCE